MKKIFPGFIDSLKAGTAQYFENIAVFPVLGKGFQRRNEFITLDEAMKGGYIEVKEISEGGSVPDLRVRNSSRKRLIIFDGETLIGAKQNRIVNTTIIVLPGKEVIIPVSCVEKGRWRYKSRSFRSSSTRLYPELRKEVCRDTLNSLKMNSRAYSDQNKVWNYVDMKMEHMGVSSPTSAMEDIFTEYGDRLTDFTKKFKPCDGQVGVGILINNQLTLLEIFPDHEILKKSFQKVISSAGLDAIGYRKKPSASAKGRGKSIQGIFKKIKEGKIEAFNGVGGGKDLRITGEGVIGSAFEYGSEILHLTVFPD